MNDLETRIFCRLLDIGDWCYIFAILETEVLLQAAGSREENDVASATCLGSGTHVKVIGKKEH